MAKISDILAQAKPRERTVMVCTRGDLAGEAARLAAELARTSEDWEPADLASVHPGRELAAQLKAVREQVKESEVPFLLRYIGDKAYSDLLAAHPSTTKPDDELFDSVTFPRALIAASCVDPKMTEDEAAELFEVINEGQIQALFDAAWDVHNSADTVPFSLAASALLAALGVES